MKFPASQALAGFVPPVLKMNESGVVPDVYVPLDPKGLVIVIKLLDTVHVAVASIGGTTGESITHTVVGEVLTRDIEEGNLTVICDEVGIEVEGDMVISKRVCF